MTIHRTLFLTRGAPGSGLSPPILKTWKMFGKMERGGIELRPAGM